MSIADTDPFDNTNPCLAPRHLVMLRDGSGIAEAIIGARQYRTSSGLSELKSLGFTTLSRAADVHGLLLPLWLPSGKQATHFLVKENRSVPLMVYRPDTPELDTKGKARKYLFPPGMAMRLDVPPLCHEQLKDPAKPLWITEGQRKGDALATHGACVVTLLGVWNWRGKNEQGGKTAVGDWDNVALNERLVYIAFDSDAATNKHVALARERLAQFLTSRGAHCQIVVLPPAADGSKQGADDFLLSHSLEDLRDLVQDATRRRNGHHAPGTSVEVVLPLSEYTNVLAFLTEHGQHVRYCYPWKNWLIWTGTHWERDPGAAVMRLAKETVKHLARQIEHMTDDVAIKALMTHIKKSLNATALKPMLENAQSEPGIPVQPEAFDVDPWLLNCTNGTLDLRTGTLRPHTQDDLLTKCLPIPYTPEAPCPTWDRFLWRIMGGTLTPDDPDIRAGELENRQAADERAQRLISFLQHAVGYSLTGATREQCLFVLHGRGANGKSTFLEGLQALFDMYGQSTPSASLLAKDAHRYDGIPNDIARLRGARLVTAVEIGEGKRLNEELVKRLTGQDTMTARFLRAEFFDFTPAFKLWIACNHLPTIRGTDQAIWRRIRLIPFEVSIPEAEQDKDLPAKLRAELPGILAWAVRGCRLWSAEGLGAPNEVQAATAAYRTAMDTVEAFLEERCVQIDDDQVKTQATRLYMDYQAWAKTTGEETLTQRVFGDRLTERGFQRQRGTGNHYYWHGLGLLVHDDDEKQ